MATLKMGDDLKKVILNLIYPVGAIYVSMNSTSPASIIGGTWTQITDRFLYCVSSGAKGTGGANSVSYTPTGSVNGHAITVNEMPAHTHNGLYWAGSTIGLDPGGRSVNIKNVQWDGYDGYGYDGKMQTASSGGSQAHSHGFTGTKATINTIPQYIKCYAWYRTA